ncbi:hypothetical protein P4O66_000079 [Electrophorus voltai]|uniref:Uncharacterized protein n=1 Tax=Electrophorus voltai TaxID=2609070 RepID=A0AAD8ZVK4_9TELE|nr:hypothetical protein P4O66_000079 [Electrophorus voltai]
MPPSIDKGSEDDDLTVRRKNFNQQHSDFKVSENTAEEEKSPVSDFTIRNRKQENSLTVDEHKRLSDESGNWSPRRSLSPNWPKHDHINRYATMPQSRKPTLIPSPTFNPFDFDSANDDVFYTPVSRRRYSSLCETEDVPHPGNTKNAGRKHFTRNILSASCADLKYGLEHGRSVSVNSVVSGRPSGPGRISVGSKPGSTTDITGLDEFVTQGSLSSIGNPCDSPRYGATSPRNHPIHNAHKGDIGGLMSGGRLWGPVNLETSLTVDTDADPTPPPSPPFSPTSRCMARIPSSSSTSSRTSQDSLSPRGHLPSRDYKSTLPVFEESPNSSETTTDDEYYVNSDDDDDDDDDDDNDDEEKETEL